MVDRVKETRRPSVISMSLGGSYSGTVNNALTSVINNGIPIVAAAGNERANACTRTPASNNGVITVGGSKNGGGMYYNTNGGSCVDIIAPGQYVLGAAHTCQDCTVYFTGTSMATPLVSGAVAILLQQQSSLTPAEIKRKLTDMCCRNILDFTDLLPSLRSTTPNCLLNVNAAESCSDTTIVVTSTETAVSTFTTTSISTKTSTRTTRLTSTIRTTETSTSTTRITSVQTSTIRSTVTSTISSTTTLVKTVTPSPTPSPTPICCEMLSSGSGSLEDDEIENNDAVSYTHLTLPTKA